MNTPEVIEKNESQAYQQWEESAWNEGSPQDLFQNLRSNVAHLQELNDRMGFMLREIKYLIKPN